ncbi:hypothetical protein BT96DRAFT_987295 [Gymnopus androsaceus JB14]|uniref:Uncharacterized protein n=1 Tax=Gymnopus androsaceus JB14 TaxID=1447944 RepID=A0A6A4I817_9AGAR|nr:hypothetical protein BT96DRAFT_987295 [Gymnopus androsaceus JB14]
MDPRFRHPSSRYGKVDQGNSGKVKWPKHQGKHKPVFAIPASCGAGAAMYQPVPSAASTSSVRFPAPGQSVGSYSQPYPQSSSLSPSSTYRPVGPSAASTSSVRSPVPGQSVGSYSQHYPQSPSLSPSSTTMYRPAGPSAASTSSVRSSASGQSEGSYSQPYSPSPSLSPSSSRSSKTFHVVEVCFKRSWERNKP